MTTNRIQREQGILLLKIVGGFVACILGIWIYLTIFKPPIGRDHCVYEDRQLLRKRPSAQTIILIDQSEAFSESHIRQIKSVLVEYLSDDKQMPVRSAVMFYVFGKNDFLASGSGQSLSPTAILCKPPATGNLVYENTKALARTFRDGFVIPLYGEIDRSLEKGLGERSPILEMLQYVSRTQDIKQSVGDNNKKTLIVVSDLLQHSMYLSHYRGGTWADFEKATLLKADLRGFNVRLLYVNRYGKDMVLQNSSHLDFWMRYFHASGANLEIVERIP